MANLKRPSFKVPPLRNLKAVPAPGPLIPGGFIFRRLDPSDGQPGLVSVVRCPSLGEETAGTGSSCLPGLPGAAVYYTASSATLCESVLKIRCGISNITGVHIQAGSPIILLKSSTAKTIQMAGIAHFSAQVTVSDGAPYLNLEVKAPAAPAIVFAISTYVSSFPGSPT